MLPTTIPNRIARVRALKPAPAMAGKLPAHRAAPVRAAVSARPGTKCHRERCLVGKVSAVITFSFVCLKVTPRGIKYKIDYMFIINRNKWLMAASPVTTGRERVRQKRGGLAGKTMIL
ncbi:conserved hypothetical protein [Klebsiella pneumoniae]|nr:conserved hypothetical protein [Klebsiella pneumoniae subsp. pneumoniae T69]CED76636.1 conserved hypothetical protein [Klebsiella pneumoniae]CTQ29081.1 conserved hypothetical protein [Klebsiella pneumoniae]SAL90796.1 conserved hypothetical protein [Klebsiella pneumoniae]